MRNVFLASVLFVVACGKGKPTQSSDDKGSAAATAATGSGTASAVAPANEAPDVELPVGTQTPPAKSKGLDEAALTRLSDLKFNGFELKKMELNDKAMIVRHTTTTAPKLSVTMLIRPCSATVVCLPMDAEKWKADPKFMESTLGKLDPKDTTVEITSTDFYGTPMIMTYVLGQSFKTDAAGNNPGTFKYAVGLYFNDGTNSIQAVAAYAGMPMKTKEMMGQAIPREDLEKSARAFMDTYTHAW